MTTGFWPARPRPQPYTEAGIRRLRCVRCGARAFAAWSICADGNNHRGVCLDCDIALNRMVLEWANHPEAKRLGDEYEAKQRAAA